MSFDPIHPLVVFLHIPKNAGSTLRRVLFSNYGAEHVAWMKLNQPQGHRAELEAKLAQGEIQLIGGHFRFGIDDGVEIDAPYFTMVRDPIARIHSFYHFIRATPTHRLHDELMGSGADLMTFATHDDTPEVRNHQVRLIAGLRRSVEATPDALQQAKHNIEEHFLTVGLQERFDESLVAIQLALGLPDVRYVSTNVNAAKPNLAGDDDTLDALRELNALDIELYRFAEARLEAQSAALGERFTAALDELHRANNAWDMRMRASLAAGMRSIRNTVKNTVRR